MMKKLTRALALLLALVLTLSTIPGNVAAAGEEVTEEDTYVLGRGGADGINNRVYVSPYLASAIDNEGVFHNKDIYSTLWAMYNSSSDTLIPAYCLDMTITAGMGVSYRRLNLEDLAYAGSTAGRIRAIIRNGFYIHPNDYTPKNPTRTHEEAIAERLAAVGNRFGIENLTLGEAISATQLAIWSTVHGSNLEFTEVYATLLNNFGSTEYLTICKNELIYDTYVYPSGYVYNYYYTSFSSMPSDLVTKIRNNIRTLYNYLCALPSESAESDSIVVSPSSFTAIHDPVFTDNGDGTCDVTISEVSVNVALRSSNDWLKLTATVGDTDYSASVDLVNGNNTKDLIIHGVPISLADEPVYLTISGYQTAEGFFLFDATGDSRQDSQTMVGYDSSRLPVFAKVVAQEMRSLYIEKSTNDNTPLGGISFDIYAIESPDALTPPNTLAEYTVITNDDGKAYINFTQMGLPDGVYLVVERDNPSIVSPIEPIPLIIPQTTEDGSDYVYEIEIHPKNSVVDDVKIAKDIETLGQDSVEQNIGDEHTWIVSASIPEDFSSGKIYKITDTLDSRLDYKGNLTARLESPDGSVVHATLTEGADYTLTKTENSFTLELTPAGKTTITTTIGSNNVSNYVLRVRFDTAINNTADSGDQIPNYADLVYTNSVNYTFRKRSDKPFVYTPDIQYGNANVLKVDADSGHPLSGAIFDLYKGSIDQNDPIESGLTSNADGLIVLENLEYDATYYLVETQAPAGYNRLTNPVAVTINANSPDPVVTIKNQKGSVLPETGGLGTEPFLFSGGLLVAASLLLLLNKKRRASS